MKLPSDTCFTLIFFIWVINLKSAAARPLSDLEDGIVDTGKKSMTDTFLTQLRIPDGTLWNESVTSVISDAAINRLTAACHHITTPIEQRRQKRSDTILDHPSWGYSYVGLHGTCSNYKESIESKIIIPTDFTNFKNEQLGQRFYVTDSIAVARVFSKHACERRKKDRSLPLIRELNPIVCRIYIKSSTLAQLSKTYIPRRVNINHQEVKLWNRDSNIEYYERMLHANPAAIAQAESQVLSTAHGAKTDDSSALPPTVRFSKIQTGEQDPSTFLPDWMPLLGALQSAWPREVLSDMVAKCDILPDIMASTPSSSTTSSSPPSSPDSLNSDSTSFTDFEDSSNSNMLSLQYDELLTFSDAGTVRRNWGRILGASIFKPMVKMGSGTEKVEYMYRNDN